MRVRTMGYSQGQNYHTWAPGTGRKTRHASLLHAPTRCSPGPSQHPPPARCSFPSGSAWFHWGQVVSAPGGEDGHPPPSHIHLPIPSHLISGEGCSTPGSISTGPRVDLQGQDTSTREQHQEVLLGRQVRSHSRPHTLLSVLLWEEEV